MGINNSLELERDLEYLKNILSKYGKIKTKEEKESSKNDFQKRCNFIVGQITNVWK